MSKKKSEELVTKNEALHLLAAQMRREDIEPDLLLKVINFYAKIAGWDDDASTPSKPEPTIDELVKQAEAQRKEQTCS